MKIFPTFCALSFISFTIAQPRRHSDNSVPRARRWKFEDNNEPGHELFHLTRRQPLSTPHDVENQPWPQGQSVVAPDLGITKGLQLNQIHQNLQNSILEDPSPASTSNQVWMQVDNTATASNIPVLQVNSEISSRNRSSYSFLSNSLSLTRRASKPASSSHSSFLSSGDNVSDRSSSPAGLDDPVEFDMDSNDAHVNTVASPTPTATNVLAHATSLSLTTTPALAQPTHARTTVFPASTTPAYAVATSTAETSSTPSGSPNGNLSSYFESSNAAFPFAIMATVVAVILVLLVIISIVKFIAHRPSFADAKDYPEGFPWDPPQNGAQSMSTDKVGRGEVVKYGLSKAGTRHGGTSLSPFAQTSEGDWDIYQTVNEKSYQVSHRVTSWNSDRPLINSSRPSFDPPKMQFRVEQNSSAQLRYSRGSGLTLPSLVISPNVHSFDLQHRSPAPLSTSSGSITGWAQNRSALNSPSRKPGYAIAEPPTLAIYDPLRPESPYYDSQSATYDDDIDPAFLKQSSAHNNIRMPERGYDARSPIRAGV
ncbi:hypothetical protein CROQUDRAFT_671601 [Cronartium quercuum f. sp. fusiforme G11]|uniref:Uncharacterized protein n=1 Tax=Cronartium quercuum f. sp. fusiforme G11 TaxID=708437 RepID=A0A9P6NLF6_9BASI|nr:hypothetical protein CROQUDRAFT_671601 [Cronartium quercuum f. sp. fusiforme G11]